MVKFFSSKILQRLKWTIVTRGQILIYSLVHVFSGIIIVYQTVSEYLILRSLRISQSTPLIPHVCRKWLSNYIFLTNSDLFNLFIFPTPKALEPDMGTATKLKPRVKNNFIFYIKRYFNLFPIYIKYSCHLYYIFRSIL